MTVLFYYIFPLYFEVTVEIGHVYIILSFLWHACVWHGLDSSVSIVFQTKRDMLLMRKYMESRKKSGHKIHNERKS